MQHQHEATVDASLLIFLNLFRNLESNNQVSSIIPGPAKRQCMSRSSGQDALANQVRFSNSLRGDDVNHWTSIVDMIR